jgi:hypothetical protein
MGRISMYITNMLTKRRKTREDIARAKAFVDDNEK